MERKIWDVIIIGGSYAGLSAAMALGRSLRQVVVIDSGLPCNRYTPASHNFLLHDGTSPSLLAQQAQEQVRAYPTVELHSGLVVDGRKVGSEFEIITELEEQFLGKKILFATGVVDIFPPLEGFAACWGKSILHCPYCHGYEVRHQVLGVMANGEMGFEFSRLLSNWSPNLTLLTNGPSTLTSEQTQLLKNHGIKIVEEEILLLQHSQGYINEVHFKNQATLPLKALFARCDFRQHSDLPERIGCELTPQGHVLVNDFQMTTVAGVYAVGDATTPLRAVSAAVAAGTKAGAFLNKELIDESF
ncbi:NAD(P)/FAD-dependent oxidoreductase [Arundinibacter roseus]|uniref:NAD(P)/FAD-dependent oxidoreductase n=1 Tax=Arundinibacter roseus TaxID=2070510 RepID=A0A4R4K4M1_9BACT|nr:NAD(P)/FAD-dependent oxidoreductase [Arundinibacter roseus]TDB62348.1 NAD(P)/FAD-dependent oxidoreductase [Arundinibacter roseus]